MVSEKSAFVLDRLQRWFSGVGKVVVAGIGNPLRMDDFVGMKVVQGLRGKVDTKRVFLIECETVPESYLQEIVDFGPTHVLLIDAAVMGQKAGTVRLVKPEQLVNFPAYSTHMLPLRMFYEYLVRTVSAKVMLLLIEPESTEFGEGLSDAVLKAAEEVERILVQCLD